MCVTRLRQVRNTLRLSHQLVFTGRAQQLRCQTRGLLEQAIVTYPREHVTHMSAFYISSLLVFAGETEMEKRIILGTKKSFIIHAILMVTVFF